MERQDRWLDYDARHGDNGSAHSQPDPVPSAIQFPPYIQERLAFCSRLVRRCHAKMSSTFDHSTQAETWFFSVSTMLISFVIFWMSCISVILAGLTLISMFLITSTANCGRRMKKFVDNMKAR